MSRTPREAAEAAIAADRAHDDPAIWIARPPDAAILERAAALEAEGPRGRPLWGRVFAVKDNIDVAGMPTTAACPGFAYTPAASAPAVAALEAAGALLLGKTNLDQFATGLVGTRSPYGVARNVFDAALVPGGSSSGSGPVVAAGIADFALGTDTAGSGRVPAAFGNIVGLKPTPGSISARGMVPACRSLDTISVFAGSVDLALAAARAMAGFDAADPFARRLPWPCPAGAERTYLDRAAPPPGLRIATADIAALCDPAYAGVHAAVASRLGAERVDLSIFFALARELYAGPWVAERSAALAGAMAASPDILHPVTRRILEDGLSRRSVDAFRAFDLLAETRRAAEALFARYDAILLPTAPFCPSLAEDRADPLGPNLRLGTFTNFANLCAMAAIAVPGGFTPQGLPVGMMVLGPAFSEGRLAGIADAVHRAATDRIGATATALPQAAAAAPLGAQEAALFCIGAHMSGLPLNGALTARGGRFLRVAATQPVYRLHALGGRPGMYRTGGSDGAAIAGEVWAMPLATLGALLAEIPPPLGLGSVLLQDGSCLGFLAEPVGLAEAPDITACGGWREWLAARRSATA
ncbi:MAG: allophanate hydrolase [Rhodospirillales bacterium]|nr:allophanate hydrolase [Rhodospirillales bacterium]